MRTSHSKQQQTIKLQATSKQASSKQASSKQAASKQAISNKQQATSDKRQNREAISTSKHVRNACAMCSAVFPALFTRFASAPNRMSMRASFLLPTSAATMSSVFPWLSRVLVLTSMFRSARFTASRSLSRAASKIVSVLCSSVLNGRGERPPTASKQTSKQASKQR
jgi:hypothetical protein